MIFVGQQHMERAMFKTVSIFIIIYRNSKNIMSYENSWYLVRENWLHYYPEQTQNYVTQQSFKVQNIISMAVLSTESLYYFPLVISYHRKHHLR